MCRWKLADAIPERLYRGAAFIQPSPIVSLNRCVAVAMVEGPVQALKVIQPLMANQDLEDFHLLHSTHADLLRRIGDSNGAANSYRRAHSC